jgi:hypothetical protein
VKITTITIQKVKNLGNYENVRVDVTATVEEGDTPSMVAQRLHEWVTNQLADMERTASAPASAA